jgi:hypothetical protein
MSKPAYKIITRPSIERLEDAVIAAIAEGYIPTGGVTVLSRLVSSTETLSGLVTEITYCQAVWLKQ